ncbi:unnamed protein product [Rhizophagus irregularis]|uniref:Uncharacterized protein n=1 Tax=Rhizophagus irregularis TaxID=588596 RepID=A0A915ZEJ2_9GLOM|nr:unnamed protein product [Rhizophagus irregularis]
MKRDVIDKDNRRLHKNNRLNKKKSCRVKGALSLFKCNNNQVKDYDKTEVLNILKDTGYHSPEDSEMDKEQLNGNRKIIITYNLSWHSDEGETMMTKDFLVLTLQLIIVNRSHRLMIIPKLNIMIKSYIDL